MRQMSDDQIWLEGLRRVVAVVLHQLRERDLVDESRLQAVFDETKQILKEDHDISGEDSVLILKVIDSFATYPSGQNLLPSKRDHLRLVQ